MQEEYSIEVDNIKKSFRVYYDKGFTLKEASLFKKRRSYEMRSVIDGISFKVKKGEAVALIGQNGCGKSTTLKMLTRIIYPDSGSIKMHGRVSSLLELGAGFHSDMTGRENIFINAAIFGLTHREIKARLNDIIEFSELGDYIDNPVRTYSSGMYMRLAFAVAINVDADILLIDEILVVGDAAFQEKCFDKLEEILKRGTTIVLVSHDQAQIERICDRCIWISDGKIKAEGKPGDINPKYLEYLSKRGLDKKAENGEKNQFR
ncbi:ABC transporter ATP-binding protein [Butyrivibrio sp. FC2001]|uniref:ABC transporter ATP-binding protein n=1 Tax=Butyrivibrio sp. FC2001 TaxID=1280671 RepID=UPI0003F621A4|nr:ABC transporter ATP-binding protein [Butyrivibrio sp. FC2001]